MVAHNFRYWINRSFYRWIATVHFIKISFIILHHQLVILIFSIPCSRSFMISSDHIWHSCCLIVVYRIPLILLKMNQCLVFILSQRVSCFHSHLSVLRLVAVQSWRVDRDTNSFAFYVFVLLRNVLGHVSSLKTILDNGKLWFGLKPFHSFGFYFWDFPFFHSLVWFD
jgi:hypothetical protein